MAASVRDGERRPGKALGRGDEHVCGVACEALEPSESRRRGPGARRPEAVAGGHGDRGEELLSCVRVCVCCVVAAGERDEGRGGDRAGKVG